MKLRTSLALALALAGCVSGDDATCPHDFRGPVSTASELWSYEVAGGSEG